MLQAAIPIVHVRDSVIAEDFYCKRLGFTVLSSWRPSETKENPCYMTVARDEAQLHVTSFEDGQIGTSNIYVFVDSVDALHAELVAKAVPIPHPPIDQTWGTREISVRDPDGNRIVFGERIAVESHGRPDIDAPSRWST